MILSKMNANLFLILSFLLIAISIFFYRKISLLKINRFLFSSLIFSSICLNLFYVISDYFTANGIDKAVIFHIRYGLADAGFSEYSGLIVSSALFVILALVFSFWIFKTKASNNTSRRKYVYAAYISAFISSLISPATADLYNNFLSLKTETAAESEFYKYYSDPFIKPGGESKNLVFIYAEGLERTYFDNELFPGLIKGLRELESISTYFTNIEQVGGTSWTMGGIVGSQCGIPLITPSHSNSMSGTDKFLPSAVCLSDLLKRKGYYLSYYGGAGLDFAGKGKFFTTHNFDEVKGRDELLPKLEYESYRSGWGLYDDALFTIGYQRFLELSESQEKFALFMLTLDTHHPNGHPSPISCQGIAYKDGSNPILNAVACSDYLIANLVKKIIQSPYGSKVVVVVGSDHLAMRNTASHLLEKGDRKNLFMIIEPDSKRERRIENAGFTLDIGATILPLIGYNGELGLGRDLTSEKRTESEIEHIHDRLSSWNPYFARLWDFPKVQDRIEINFSQGFLAIDDRTFKIPALVELNENLETILKFDFYKSGTQKGLIEHVQALDENTAFLLVDTCENASKLHESFGKSGACIVAGKNGKYWNIGRIFQPVADALVENELIYRLNSDDIRYFSGFTSPFEFQAHRIAHAGGGVSMKTYTNSYEALNENIKKRFEYFELDFSFTSDGHLVCIHDWQDSFARSFGFRTMEWPTLEVFNSLVKNKSEFQKCTLDGLIAWMKQNPSAKIVTDVKDDNLAALQLIAMEVPDFEKRIIPQIYNPSNYTLVREMGYEQIIWTLYRFKGSNKEVLRWVDTFKGPFAITMPKNRASAGLPPELARKHIPTYVHTINSLEEKNTFFYKFGIADIYTDFLDPQDTGLDTQTSGHGA